MIKIAICDDSPCDAAYLEKLCNECDMLYEIKTQVFTNAELFLDSHQKDPYDIVFLDIEMPNQSGIELGMQLKKINQQTIIIFSTSYPQYAIEVQTEDKVIFKKVTLSFIFLRRNKTERIMQNNP